ncbi:mucosal pentraxin-like isoform X2 [Motacilla alba alba]|uniref:mucosal pentraxin-like isoform X2 n=1 Tax=Motacilla alba alba TaxID=1094192 RepID=UPI0018D58038|nr:mucosal pentraxin-like isoform X2 [Motacilla alba alba]
MLSRHFPTALGLGDEGQCHHKSRCHSRVSWEQPLSSSGWLRGPSFPTVVTVAGFDGAMGPLWLCLLILAALFGPTAPQGEATRVSTLPDLGSSVFVFPRESQSAHVQVTATLEKPLNNFTVCLKSYTDLTRPYSLFSYATRKQSNEILLFKPKPGQYDFNVGNKFLSFTVPEVVGGVEHVCVSWESSTGIVRFWFNGKPWPRKGLQKGYTVGVPASILLGQDQDSFGGGFDAQQSFVGEISSVYMWDMGISTLEAVSAMYDTPGQTPIFGWKNFPYKIVGEVYLKP